MTTRREIVDRIPMLHQILTAKQYEGFVQKLEAMSDHEFDQFMAEAKYYGESHQPESPKEFWEMTNEIRQRNGITRDNCAANVLPMQYTTEEGNKRLWAAINRSKPSDQIVLSVSDDEYLCGFWRTEKIKQNGILPSDLFFAGNVSLLDCVISVDERDIGGYVCDCRVVVFGDYRERIENSRNGEATVGALIVSIRDGALAIPIGVVEGYDGVMLGDAGWKNIPQEVRERSVQEISQQKVINMAAVFMATWYGIQISLVHPVAKDVFAHPKTVPVKTGKSAKGSKRKRVTRYIRRHIINAGEIERAVCGESRGYTRKTLCWYVIGHWRHYANGKKVFIQPYWKGALREMKQNLDEGRDRIIEMPEGDAI